MAELTNMKRESRPDTGLVRDDDDGFPWGLRIHLEGEDFKRLGMERPPGAGSELLLVARVTVKDTHESDSDDGEKHVSAGMQITDMSLATAPSTDEGFNALYPNMKKGA